MYGLGSNGCAGVDLGDGFDCYGVPVYANDPRTRRLTELEQADVWRRLRLTTPQWYSFEEQAHLRAGTFGEEGLALWLTQTGGAQPLATVPVVGVPDEGPGWGWLMLPFVAALFYFGTGSHKSRSA